jgi:Ca2+-binding RTX toxin-like protein
MAITIKVLTSSNVDVRELLGHVAHVDDIDPRGSSRFTGEDDSHNYIFEVRGSGFKYSPLGIPTDGLASRITIDKGSAAQLQIDLSPKLAVKTAIKASSLESFIDSQVIKMTGGKGNDTFDAGKKGDILKGGLGNDTLEGGRGNDQIYGDDGNDTLRGEKDNDKIYGGKGNDDLFGSAGNDILTGDQGRDDLHGGAGIDRFDFNKLSDSPDGSDRDTIHDFSQAQGDRIDLRDIDADTTMDGKQDFTFIGDDPFTDGVVGQLRQDGDIVQGDVNGNGVADFEIRLVNAPTLTEADFLL